MLTVRSDETDCSIYLNELASQVSLFGALSEAQLESLLHYLIPISAARGDFLFRQGDLPKGLYVLVQGSVDLVRDSGSFSQRVAHYECGQTIGDTAYVGIQAQVASARVCSDHAQLLFLDISAIVDLQQRDPAVFSMLMMNIARDTSRKLHQFYAH